MGFRANAIARRKARPKLENNRKWSAGRRGVRSQGRRRAQARYLLKAPPGAPRPSVGGAILGMPARPRLSKNRAGEACAIFIEQQNAKFFAR